MPNRRSLIILSSLLLLALLLAACQPVQPAPPAPAISTAGVTAQLSNQPGRAIVSARGNHFVIDSVPPLGGPNEEVNPMDALLTALGTCGVFLAETAAPTLDIPLQGVTALVQADFDPRGLQGEDVDPRIQAMRVHLTLPGASAEEAAELVEIYQERCPIYTTLIQATPIEISTGDEAMSGAVEGLTTSEATVQLSNQPGRALVTARGNHFVVDSIPPLGGPNEERNPMDLFLGALGTCGIFIYETAAGEMGISLDGVSAMVEADFDPRGIRDGSSSPHIQALRVDMSADGPSAEEAEQLAQAFQQRCPIYTTLSRAAPITLNGVEMAQKSGILLEIDFAYNVTTEDFIAAVSPLAPSFAASPGLQWKIWALDAENSRFSGIILFDDDAALQNFLESELAATVTGHPALSDFRITPYEIMGAETELTRGPITATAMDNAVMGDESGDSGALLRINFHYNVPATDFVAAVSPLAEDFAAAEGLRWKIWGLNEEESNFSGLLFFEDTDAMQAFLESDLAATVMSHPALSDFEVTPFEVMTAETMITHGPVGLDAGEGE